MSYKMIWFKRKKMLNNYKKKTSITFASYIILFAVYSSQLIKMIKLCFPIVKQNKYI